MAMVLRKRPNLLRSMTILLNPSLKAPRVIATTISHCKEALCVF
jgi:hypothetical protein